MELSIGDVGEQHNRPDPSGDWGGSWRSVRNTGPIYFLDAGRTIQRRSRRHCPLQMASAGEDVRILQLTLRSGASDNGKTSTPMTFQESHQARSRRGFLCGSRIHPMSRGSGMPVESTMRWRWRP